MATNTSEHLGLNLWEPSDQVLREEFNENWTKLDEEAADIRADLSDGLAAVNAALNQTAQTLTQNIAALTANVGSGGHNCRIAYGTYTGTGTYGASAPKTFSCDFVPVMLIVGTVNQQENHHMILIHGSSVSLGTYINRTITVGWEARAVKCTSTEGSAIQMDQAGTQYCYVILGYDDGQ